MEGKLIKTGDQFLLRNKENEVIAITSGTMEGRMLSLKNCEAIANGYDLDELKKDFANNHKKETDMAYEYGRDMYSFQKGFQKALEILGNKKFSEKDIERAFIQGVYTKTEIHRKKEEYIQSLQQTEWDVEIEMEQYVKYVPKSLATVYPTGGVRPKLDSNGCLILKRK